MAATDHERANCDDDSNETFCFCYVFFLQYYDFCIEGYSQFLCAVRSEGVR